MVTFGNFKPKVVLRKAFFLEVRILLVVEQKVLATIPESGGTGGVP